VSKGGMVLVNVHPDYINFDNNQIRFDEFSVKFYNDLLNYLGINYKDQYWNALPKEAAAYIKDLYK